MRLRLSESKRNEKFACREMNEVEKLLNILERCYNVFIVESAAVAKLVKKVWMWIVAESRWTQ